MGNKDLQVRYALSSYHAQNFYRAGRLRHYLNKESVSISPEGRKRFLADNMAQEILNQFRAGNELPLKTRGIPGQLVRECGKPMEIMIDQGRRIVFKTFDERRKTSGLFLQRRMSS